MLNIVQIDPADRHRRRQFLSLPFALYEHIPQWVPPLSLEAGRYLDQDNPFYQHSEAAFMLACDGETPIGRVAVLNNRHYNAYNSEQSAFFTLFECVNRVEVATALFDAVFAWAKGRGLNKVIGPKGFTALDGMGLLVKGFEHRPAFGIAYNPPYYASLIEAAGYRCQGELVSGYMNPSTPFPGRVDELAELVKRRRGLSIMQFKSRHELRNAIPKLRDLYNRSLSGTVGNTPLTDSEIDSMAQQLEWFADPRLIKIVMKDDCPVGFCLAYPDISAALQRTRGHLAPLGWFDMLLELKRTKWVNVNGAGIAEKYRGLGGTAMLFSEMRKSVIEAGYQHAEIVQIGVENESMQREMRDLGIDFYKLHRVYEKNL